MGGASLLDPNIGVDVVFVAEGTALLVVATVFGDRRDFGLDLGGTNGILKSVNMLSSSLVVGVGVLFIRASMRASGL